MATSGTVSWRPTVDEFIIEAFERAQLDIAQASGNDMVSARRSLNFMFTEWAVRGINYFKTEALSLSLTQGTASYDLPAGTIDVLSATVRRSGTDQSLTRMSLTDYQAYPTKTTQGMPANFFLDRQYTPSIILWPVPENSTDTVEYWTVSQIEDITASNQDADVPYRWSDALAAGLAARLAEKKKPELYDSLKLRAEVAFNYAADDERERATFRIRPPSVIS